jgi:hypothetical protein
MYQIFQDIQKNKDEKVFSDRGSTDNNTNLEHDSAYFRKEFYGGAAKKKGKPIHSTKAVSKVFREDLPQEMLFKSSKVLDPFANLTDTESIRHKTHANFFNRASAENSENNLLMPV